MKTTNKWRKWDINTFGKTRIKLATWIFNGFMMFVFHGLTKCTTTLFLLRKYNDNESTSLFLLNNFKKFDNIFEVDLRFLSFFELIEKEILYYIVTLYRVTDT